MTRRWLPLGASVAFFLALGGLSWEPEVTAVTLTPQQQASLIAGLTGILQESYVCPETAAGMCASIARRLREGAYAKVTDPPGFANAVFLDMYAFSKDKQLRFSYSPQRAADILRAQRRDLKCSALSSLPLDGIGVGSSGAEEFCYIVNELEQSVVPHPVQFMVVQSAYVLTVPCAPQSSVS